MPILCVFETDVFVVQKGLFLYKTSKIVFSRFIFTIFDMGLTWLQGVKEGYRGLQGVTTGYRGLQGITRGYKGLKWVSKDYKNFFLTRTFPDTSS